MNKISGIYSITNIIDNKIYYGSSIDINHRWYIHKLLLNRNNHNNTHLQFAWLKYGESAFKFEILKEVPVELLLDTEQAYLDIVKESPELYYNIALDSSSPNLGKITSEETKKKLSLALKGKKRKPFSEKWKNNISNSKKGKLHSEDTKHKWSILRMGKNHDDKVKRKISESNKGKHHDKTVYTFKNKVTNETFTGIQVDFYNKYNLDKSSVNRFVKGGCKWGSKWTVIKSHKGWILCK